MTRNSQSIFRSSLVALVFTSGVALAQDQPPTPPQTAPPSNGGWRRVGDVPQADPQAPPATPPQVDPTQPVDRSDAYGQAPAYGQSPGYGQPPSYGQSPGYGQPGEPMQPQGAAPQGMPQASNRPPYGTPAQLTLRQGTFFTVRTNQMLSSSKNKSGDFFTATLTQPLIAGGIVVAERGQEVAGVVNDTGRDKDGKRFIRLQLTGITAADGSQIPIHTQLSALRGPTMPAGAQAGAIIGTTAAGAAIGGIAAWGTGAAIGAGAGALAGIAAVVATRNQPAVIFPESALTFQMTQPATVSTVNSPQAFRFAGPGDFQTQPTLVRGGPGSRPGPYPGAAYAPGPGYGYGYPPAYSYGPGYYPGYSPYFYGPSVGIVVGRGWGWGWGGRRW
jgi:hypothetical protein